MNGKNWRTKLGIHRNFLRASLGSALNGTRIEENRSPGINRQRFFPELSNRVMTIVLVGTAHCCTVPVNSHAKTFTVARGATSPPEPLI